MRALNLLAFLGLSTLATWSMDCSEKSSHPPKPELHVYNWRGFIGSKTIPEFEQRFSASVIYENYSSNEELYAKLKMGSGPYDVIVPSTYMVQVLVKEGFLQPLDQIKLSNFKNLSNQFVNLPIDPGNRFSVPYLWGTTGLGVNIERVREEGNDLGLLFEPKYKGRISVLEGMRYTLGIALRYLGLSANTKSPEELERARQLLIQQKPLVKAYTDSYLDLLSQGKVWISYVYSGDTYQLAKKSPSIQYFVPRQGTLIGMDSLCVPKNAKNPKLAHAFINYLLEPEVTAQITNELLYASPNRSAYPYIEKTILADPSIYPPQDVFRKSEFLEDVGEATQLYEKIWAEIRAN